jgi:hypothetical protein
MKYTLKIMVMLFMVVLTGATMGIALGVNPMWIIGVLLVASFAPRPVGALTATLIDLARPNSNNPGSGGGIKSEIILIPAENINWGTTPARAVDGVTISDITLKAGKYMKRLYMSADVIEPSQKKIKGSNIDSGGWEISIKGFYPGFGQAIMSWIALHGYSFKGIIIIQNCADGTKYMIGEPCNYAYIDDVQSKWGATVEKERGQEITFTAKQPNPMAIYTGVIKYDPTSASW